MKEVVMNGRKVNHLIIQQLATNLATNGMEFVLDFHDFVCCMDDSTLETVTLT